MYKINHKPELCFFLLLYNILCMFNILLLVVLTMCTYVLYVHIIAPWRKTYTMHLCISHVPICHILNTILYNLNYSNVQTGRMYHIA